MTDFWSSDIGEVTGNAEDAFAKQFTHIPDNTMALARIETFSNQEYKENNFKYLQIDWILTEGDFKGQKVQQKLKVFGGDTNDKDPSRTKHRALNMFKLLYQLFNMKPKHSGAPTNEDLALFIGKIAGIKIRETEPNSNGKQYNWVAEVHKAQGFKCETGTSLVINHTHHSFDNSQQDLSSAFSRYESSHKNDELSNDIPF